MLVILGGVFFVLQVIIMPETMPYIVYKRKHMKKDPSLTNPFPKPKMMAPWVPFKFLSNYQITLISILAGLNMGILFNSISNVIPYVVRFFGYLLNNL
jgi:hypothetical protein